MDRPEISTHSIRHSTATHLLKNGASVRHVQELHGHTCIKSTVRYTHVMTNPDPKYSRWLSTDPALGEYIPEAPVNEEARKRNGNLPGMGGVYNTINLNLYHYEGNNPMKFLDMWGLSASDAQKPNIDFIIIRDPKSYDTVNNQNPALRGKDLLIITNRDTFESISIPITSVPTMKGTVLADALAPGNVELTLGPKTGSKYSPNVLTISGGTLMSGDTLRKDGTTENNNIPWRGHDTNYFGSEGCLVGKEGSPSGSMVNVVETLQSWGSEYGDTISGTLISGPRGH